MSASYDDLSDKVQAQAAEIAGLKNMLDGFRSNKGLVSNYQDASKAVDMFNTPINYRGSTTRASHRWEWAVSQVRGES